MSGAEAAVRVQEVTVNYGRRVAVDDVSFTVPRGSVYALLGRNGAGKSSLIRCLVGQQRADRGQVRLLDLDSWTDRTKVMDRVGVVPEDADAPPGMTVRQIGDFCNRVYSRWDRATAAKRLERFSIDGGSRFGTLSKGQKKQVLLAFALAMSPEVLVLDDPTLGLDVVARKSLFDEVIAELADRGTSLLITTHDLAGIEALADRVGIMRDGKLVVDEEMETLKSRYRRIRVAGGQVALAAGNLAVANVRQWGSGSEAVVSNYDEVAFERFRASADTGHTDASPMSLEEVFIEIAGEEGAKS